MNRSLLLLAYYFAPHQAVAAVRTTAMARHLANLGWHVTVVTVDDALLKNHDSTLCTNVSGPGRLETVRTGHRLRFLFPSALKTRNRGLARLAGGLCRVVTRQLGIEREIGWRGHARRALGRLKAHDFDVVLSSGGPWFSYSLTAGFSRASGVPYVLDYHDLWCGNPHRLIRPTARECREEQRVRREAAAITAVSPSILAAQETVFGAHACAAVVTDGYEPPFDLAPASPKEAFSLVYAGQFLPPRRTAAPFIRAFKELRRRHPEAPLSLLFVGPSGEHVRRVVQDEGADPGITIMDSVPRSEVVKFLQDSGVVLVAASSDRRSSVAGASMIPGKLYEIIGLRKPYLVVAPENSDIHSIVRIAGGGRIFPADDPSGMAGYLEQVMLGQPPAYAEPEAFSWHRLGARMSGILEEAAIRRVR